MEDRILTDVEYTRLNEDTTIAREAVVKETGI